MFMKKFIKVLGIVAILGSLGIASTGSSDVVGVSSENSVEDITTVQMCDAIMRVLGVCRSSQTLSPEK
jgi:hypothetical protein